MPARRLGKASRARIGRMKGDEGVSWRVWMGVVPGRWACGSLVLAGGCAVGVPGYVRRWLMGSVEEEGKRG